jgi:hypothetical protein
MAMLRLARRPFMGSARPMVLTLMLALSLNLLAGCSTAPCADFLDWCKPGSFPANPKGVAGGVCVPQGGGVAGLTGAIPVAQGPPGAVPSGGGFGPQSAPDAPAPAPVGNMPIFKS